MEREISIVDRGRGPQLTTSRITIQDLFSYFEMGYTPEQIIREAMPSLSTAEIEVARRYVDEHREDVLEEDRRIRERNASRKNSPQVQEILRQGREQRLAWLERHRNQHVEAPNGDGRSS